MRVLIAPDKFAGTLSASEAAAAIGRGWRRSAPDDELICRPVADGGPGFAAVLAEALGGTVEIVVVRGPLGTPTPVGLVVVGRTVYLESAQACGHRIEARTDPMLASSFGVGQALSAAIARGAERIVIGLGGSVTSDGGAGLLHALGARADVPLDAGPQALSGISWIDIAEVERALAGIDLVGASDVTAPLLGMFGAARVFGPQKGMDDEQIWRVDRILDAFVDVICGPTPSQRRIAEVPGAGAAGGLGFALAVLGAQLTSGTSLVLDTLDIDSAIEHADLVITGEGAFDVTSRSGKAVYGMAQRAARYARPCVVLAGGVDVGAREMRAMGIESAYSMIDSAGRDRAFAAPAETLADLAQRVASTWSS